MKLDIKKIQENKPIKDILNFSMINIDKPTGPTSFSVSNFIKIKTNVSKTSHFGTLDPMVTGVLPVALGRACRLSDYFMHHDKEYVGIMHLHENISDEKLKEEVKKFIGKIIQLPPVRSRVKRAERIREVKSFEILERTGKDVLFKTDVQAGTYIRKLIHDIGENIGGAHMLELRRTRASIFDESTLVNLYEFESTVKEFNNGNEKPLREVLIPAEIIKEILPPYQIKKEFVKKLLTGSPLFSNFLKDKVKEQKDEKICIFLDEIFIGCYKVVKEGDIIAVPEFVFN